MERPRHSLAAFELEASREIELDAEDLPLVPGGAASVHLESGGRRGPAAGTAALDAARHSSSSSSALLAFTLISSLGGFLFGQ